MRSFSSSQARWCGQCGEADLIGERFGEEGIERFDAAGGGIEGAGVGEIVGGVGGAFEHAVDAQNHVAAVGFAALGVGFEEVEEALSLES